MKAAALLLMTLCVTLSVSAVAADEKEALKAVAGTWIPIAGELAGEKFPAAALQGMKLVLDGDKYTLTNAVGDDKGIISVDASQKPMAMDILGKEGPNKDKKLPAIYEVNDGTLTICYDLSGQTRPTEFKTKPNTKLFLVTYKMEKKTSATGGLEILTGKWTGSKRLWLTPKDPPADCDATAVVTQVAQGSFTCIQYTWSYLGKPQDGMLLIGQKEKAPEVKAVWVDSWHMGRSLMTCEGKSAGEDGTLVKGSYAAPPGADWGWKIRIVKKGEDAFQIVMHKISPDGTEYLAVELNLRRP